MASTGEVPWSGRDKYDAYIKTLISTGSKLPESNILLSLGALKEKMEMLPSIATLRKLGYNLFVTTGTADLSHPVRSITSSQRLECREALDSIQMNGI